MRITQCRYDPKRISKFKYFLDDNKLQNYNNKNAPAIFFGMYSGLCFKTLRDHKGLAIVIWRGTDTLKKNRLKSVIGLKNPNIKHVAISKFIIDDLKKYKLSYKFIPIPGVKINDIPVENLGNEIYAYISPKRFNFYGGHIINQIKDKIPFKININNSCDTYIREELMEVYKKSFIGLRLTEHDGIANQVVELGLMGRRCIHNGNHPNAVPWNSVEGIIKIIKNESLKIGQKDTVLATKVKEYINVDKQWLQTDYWSHK